MLPRQPDQPPLHSAQELGVGREHDVLGNDRRVDRRLGEVGRLDHFRPGGDDEALLNERHQPLLAHDKHDYFEPMVVRNLRVTGAEDRSLS
jgi:hypothetical protein